MFYKHPLNPAQEIAGQIFSVEQIMVLENEISRTAEQIVKTAINESDPDRFVKMANARGQIEILEFLIARSNSHTQIKEN